MLLRLILSIVGALSLKERLKVWARKLRKTVNSTSWATHTFQASLAGSPQGLLNRQKWRPRITSEHQYKIKLYELLEKVLTQLMTSCWSRPRPWRQQFWWWLGWPGPECSISILGISTNCNCIQESHHSHMGWTWEVHYDCRHAKFIYENINQFG